MANYTLHLGFHWGSPVIGSVFGAQGPTSYRTLQYALADDRGAPAWFTFQPADAITVVVWNLTQASLVVTAIDAVAMSFLALEGKAEGALPPSRFVSCQDGFGDTALYHDVATKPYLQVSRPTQPATQRCPWGPSGTGYVVDGTLALNAPDSAKPWSFKWSFCVQATAGGASGSPEEQTYLSDPEVIVGSQGRPPPTPGPR